MGVLKNKRTEEISSDNDLLKMEPTDDDDTSILAEYELDEDGVKQTYIQKDSGNKEPYKWDIVWFNVFFFALLYIGAAYGWVLKSEAKLYSNIFAKFLTCIPAMAVTGGAHRLWSHRAYKANFIVELYFALTISMTHLSSIYNWVREHRMHHKYTDTDADPHNSARGFFFSHIGWMLIKKHKDIKTKGHTIFMDDMHANKLVMFQHKYYYYLILIFGVVMPCTVACYFWGESLKVSFFYLVLYRYTFALNCILGINSFAHLWGTKPYDKNIGPVENPFMIYVGFGEGFHNYHHTFPWDYKAAEFGSDSRNATTYLIDFFAWLGWVTDRKTVPKEMLEKRLARTGDGSYHKETPIVEKLAKHVPRKYLRVLKRTLLMGLFLYVMP